MEKVAIDAVDNEKNPMKVHSVRKPVSRALGTQFFAMNYFELESGELIRFPPGEFQKGYNDADETVEGWALGALGASHDWDELESLVYCPECEAETVHDVGFGGDAFELTCTDCGTTQG